MHNRSELFEQSLLPDIYIQSQTTVFKGRLLKQRKNLFIALAILFLIIFSTTIASACLIKETKQYSSTLIDINQQIAQVQLQLDEKITNQKISFNSTDNLKTILISSTMNNGERKIATLDIQESNMKELDEIKVPTLKTLCLPNSIEGITNNILGIHEIKSVLPNLKTVNKNIFLELQELHLINSAHLQFVAENTFNKLKRMSIINTTIKVFDQNKYSQLQYLQFNNNTNLQIIVIIAPTLRQLKLEKTNATSLVIERSNLSTISNFQNSSTLTIMNSPIYKFQCRESNKIHMLAFNNLLTTSFVFSSPVNKRINLINMSRLEQVKIGISSLNITNEFALKIYNTSLKSLSNENNNVNAIEMFQNHNLLYFENNTMPRLVTIFISMPLTTFCNNHLQYLIQLRVYELIALKKFNGNLRNFSSNHCPILTSLDLSFQQIIEFKNNILISLTNLKITNNKINDAGAISILNDNVWSAEYVKSIDLRNNSINDTKTIRKKYQQIFTNAQILL